MKTVAISASGANLDSCVEPRFGRARFFILVDPATGDWEPLDNLANLSSLLDVGILTAKNLTKNRVVEAVVTGHCGPKAFKELQHAGVKVFLNARGSLRLVLNKLRQGELQEASGPNVPVYGGHER
ncbi:MAG: NifB/NifX family molybdenum-iron cluster-binding protein [Syntrophales bacterium]|nr:NifB/NifX family molybdenum-iron cluster-binding protein [Syntrophales bacterium]MDD5642820.1 NifB/NifX family molybdenum-iron cluster-binding protein [Syntrophales bacterium]